MIYFLDNSLQLQKIVTSKNVISAIHEHELNGLIRADVELDLSYAKKFLILGIDHVGYYYKDEFYLHKIQRVEYDHVNESAKVVLRHIFFEDMIFGKLIRDVRPQNQDALTVSQQTIDTNTRWQTIMTDVTGRLSTNFYWQVPYEVIEFMTENYRIEYQPKILFDGEKINGFQLHLANKIGEDKNIRIPYGSRVLDLKYEEDYSEIITKLVVHGKGEEVGSGYGRRIDISDVNFSRNGVKSPVGSLYLEDESITNTYGNDDQTPREGREIFEDIEDPNKLAEAGYQHYLQVSRPQMLFTADVADIGDVGIGDSVMIIRHEYGVYFNARIHKLSVDLLYPEDAQVELGDYKHFKESKIARKSREKSNRVQGQLSDRITRLKLEANERFDNEVAQWKAEYEQALIDAAAEVEAMRVEMEAEFATVRKDMTDRFETEKDAAYEEAQRNYDAISDRITDVIDTARTEMNTAFDESVRESKAFAEAEAEAKAQAVQSNLETFEAEHNQLISDLNASVDSTFESINSEIIGLTSSLGTLGDSLADVEGTLTNTKTQLENQISDARTELEQSISNTRTELEGRIDTAEQVLGKVGEDLGNAKTDLQNQLDDARKSFDELEIGGRNLLPAFTSNRWTHQNRTEIEDYSLYIPSGFAGNSILFMDVEKHTNYTMTFNSDYARYYIYEVLEDESLGSIIRTRTGSETYTFNTEDVSRIRVSLNTFSGNVQEEKNIWNLKLERGTFATDWTPAPEDTDNKITNINQTITNIEGELSTKVEQTEVDTLKGTVTAQGTLLTQTVGELSSKAEKGVVDTLTGRVANTESSVTQNAEEIAKRLTKSVYDEDKIDTDAKITQWSNTASETAEGLERVIGRVSQTENGVETAQTRIEAEAGRIDGVLSRTSEVEGKVQDAELSIKANADGLALKATKTEVEQVVEGIDDSISEVTDRVTVAEAELIVQAGEISQKATQSELDRVTGRVSTAETSITQNATEIARRLVKSDYDSDKAATDIEITKWSNLTTETAEGLEQTITRLSTEEEKITKVQADIIANANEIALKASQASLNSVTGRVSSAEAELLVQSGEIALKASQSSVNTLTGEINSLESQLSIQADEIRGVVEDTNSLGAQVSDLRLSSESFTVTIGQMEADLTEKINGVDTWHYNMLRGTRFDEDIWQGQYMEKVDADIDYFEFVPSRNSAMAPYIQTTQDVQFNKGETYTLSFDFQTYAVRPINNIWIISNEEGVTNHSIHPISNHDESSINKVYWSKDFRRYFVKFTSIKDINGFIRIGINFNNADSYAEHGRRGFQVRLPYLTTTDNTRWLYHQLDSNQNIEEVTRRISKIEQTVDSIDLMVAEISDTALRQSEIYVGTSGIQLGSTYVGDTQLASILSVSPKSIDVITKNMNLTGNLNVKGQIESIAMSAVRGNFASLFANQVEANVIDVDHISGRTAWFERLYTLSTNINRLTAQFIFTEAIHAKSLDAIEANIGRVRTAFLKADVISGTHISSNTIEVKHLTGYDAILNTLMARSVFSNEVKTLSIDAVEANIGSIRSKILTSNVVQSSHIASGTALIDKIFSSNAMFERMMAKSAFVTTLSAIALDLHELTIWRPDGVAVIQNGMQRFGLPVTFVQQVDGGGAGEVFIHPNYWETNSRGSRTVGAIFTEHAGRWLNIGVGIGLRADAQHASTKMAVVIRPSNTPSGSSWGTHIEEFTVYRGSTDYPVISVPLGRPTFGAASWTLEFYRIGDNVRNPVQLRRRRIWVSA